MSPWLITDHAIERYIERHARTITPEQARAELLARARSSRRVQRVPSEGGLRDVYALPGSDLELLVQPVGASLRVLTVFHGALLREHPRTHAEGRGAARRARRKPSRLKVWSIQLSMGAR